MSKNGAASYFRRSNPRLITTSEMREPSGRGRIMLRRDGRMLCVNRRRRRPRNAKRIEAIVVPISVGSHVD
jgi:hypothetical protein